MSKGKIFQHNITDCLVFDFTVILLADFLHKLTNKVQTYAYNLLTDYVI